MKTFKAVFGDNVGQTQGNLYDSNGLIQYFPVKLDFNLIGDMWDTSKHRLIATEDCKLHIWWQVFIIGGAARADAVIGGKIIRNPVPDPDPALAGWGPVEGWQEAGLGTFWSQPGMAWAAGSCAVDACAGDEFGLFMVCTPDAGGEVVVHGHRSHTWLHGFAA